MRAGTAWILVAVMGAGCFHGTEDPVGPLSDANPLPLNRTDPERILPQNRTGEFAAFRETNVTSGADHGHDGWLGRTRMTLVETIVRFDPLAGDPSALFAEVVPALGSLVLEGTGALEVTLGAASRSPCSPIGIGTPACVPSVADPASPPPSLRFLHAASDPDDWQEAGATPWASTATIDVPDPRWTDMPHAPHSYWVFRFEAPDASAAGLAFDVRIDIVRSAGDVPKWPGHPEFYAKSHYRLIYDGPGEVTQDVLGRIESKAVPGKLVSAGTKTLLVFVNVTKVEAAVPPDMWWLQFHNASRRGWSVTDQFDPAHSAKETFHAWALPVDANGMDSPYATESRWDFIVRGTHDSLSCARCVPYKVVYSMTIWATDLPPPAYDDVLAST